MKKNYLILLALVATFQATLQAQTVAIGTQIWQTTNLDVTTYSDGTPIPQVTDPTAWANLKTGAWCYNNNDSANGAIYGKLYNGYAVAGIFDAASKANPALRKNLAPTGWHVPTDGEWSILINYLDPTNGSDNYSNVAGGMMKETGTTHWTPTNVGASNNSNFTGLPGGFCNQSGEFTSVGGFGLFWSSTEIGTSSAAYSCGIYNSVAYALRGPNTYEFGFSVRLVSGQLGFEQQTISKIAVYPNPTSSTLTLQTTNNITLDKITITDLTGKVVLTQTTNTTQVNVASLANGLYVIEAVSGNEKLVSKFVKE
jgi:uncharacterized protein (TIGR02145 family)